VRPKFAWAWVLPAVAAELCLEYLASGPLTYGYMSDEFYYLDCVRHLAWGYVDHPPLSIAALAGVRAVLGDSVLGLHAVPALLGAANILGIAALARELRGGAVAQGLAALAALVSPVFLAVSGFWSMNAIEPPLWTLAYWLVARIASGAPRVTWLWLGLVLGLGLMNKISMLWFGFGLAVGLLATPERRWLATPWPWACAGLALLVFAPHLAWQVQNGWPTLEFMHNATADKMTHKSVLEFVGEQALLMTPLGIPVWLAGAIYLFVRGGSRRILGWIWLTVLVFLSVSGSARSNYSAPAYAAVIAAGGVAWESIAIARPRLRWVPLALALLLALGLSAAPLGIPLVPPDRYPAYEAALGVRPPKDQIDALGPLPLHFALRFGWVELVDGVARAYQSLTPEERARAVIVGQNFAETGALNFYGPARGLPRAVSGHNNYWLWGPGTVDGSAVIVIGHDDSAARLREDFASVERAGEIHCRYCMPALDHDVVYVCRGLRRPIDQIWAELKHYI